MSPPGGSGRRRKNRRSKSGPIDPLPPIPKISRGKLTLTEKQQRALNSKKERRKITSRTIFAVLMDVDNITEQLRVNNPGFDVDTLQRRVQAFLDQAEPGSKIYKDKLIGVGNMKKFFYGMSRFTPWKGVLVHDIFARTLQCKHCKRIYLQAENNNRMTVKYENLTDVCDAKLEHLILSHARNFPDHKFLIVGGDRDFVRCITILRVCRGEVYLALSDACGLDFENAVHIDNRVEFQTIIDTPPAAEVTK